MKASHWSRHLYSLFDWEIRSQRSKVFLWSCLTHVCSLWWILWDYIRVSGEVAHALLLAGLGKGLVGVVFLAMGVLHVVL